MKPILILPLAAAVSALPGLALAQDAEYATLADTTFIFNTLLFLIGGFLVFWMAAGFAMLEAGLVRSKNVTTQLTKNMGLFAIAAVMYWLVGYNIMYPGEGNWIIEGIFGTFATKDIKTEIDAGGYSNASDFFFQLMFCATTASIVSGALAERIKLWPFLIFVVVLTGFIYPMEASWQWGGGFLSAMGFSDFAGSTLVHAAGGFAALAGAIVLGPRLGKYGKDGRVVPMPGSNLALATLGTFILWMGWFGFNGGSELMVSNIAEANAVSDIFVNTNAAASGGLIAALILAQLMYGKADLTMAVNGALAGLVAITAEPLAWTGGAATLVGAVGGVIVVFSVKFMDSLKIDDPVGAISVHGVVGIWGLLAVCFSGNDSATLVGQLTGIVVIFTWTFVTSFIVWTILKAAMGIRISEEQEFEGCDIAECGIEAYPEFSSGK